MKSKKYRVPKVTAFNLKDWLKIVADFTPQHKLCASQHTPTSIHNPFDNLFISGDEQKSYEQAWTNYMKKKDKSYGKRTKPTYWYEQVIG